MENPRTIVLYHGNCPDGFGGAYAAWKKFGDTAEYMPLHHNRPAPLEIKDSILYFIDFCYPKNVMDQFVAQNKDVTVLDHHEGLEEVVETMPHYVYDSNRSGATIAWSYFHPEIPVPQMFKYVEDGDLYRFVHPEGRAILAYVYAQPYTFPSWESLIARVESEEGRAAISNIGTTYLEYKTILMKQIAATAEPVRFEGYECMLASASRVFVSDVGHELYTAHPPIALVVNTRVDGLRVSMRGDGTVDLAKIAQKYGGNGHFSAAAFSLPWGTPIPWEVVKKEEV
ncbi:MAG: hypothetical protein ABIT47_02540 [Candidatus Paceibacterota bacterium]